MIITISGKPGGGKTTVGKIVAEKLGFRHYSMGQRQRDTADKLGLSLAEYGKLCEKDRKYDVAADEWQKNLGEEEDNFVMEARIGFYFIPESKKIFLDIDEKEAAKRVFKDKTRKHKTESVEEELKLIKERQKSELKRYKKYYNLNHYDKKNFDLVIDTTNRSIKEIVDKILEFVK